MYKRLARNTGVLAGLIICSAPSSARIVESWPYDKLMKEADLVVVARPVKTELTADAAPENNWPLEMVGQDTTFEVKHAFQGKMDGTHIKVLHFKFGNVKKGLDPKHRGIPNGPNLVAFRLKEPPEYLLFLKRLKDGRYEPLSGRIDPMYSVRLLASADNEIPAGK